VVLAGGVRARGGRHRGRPHVRCRCRCHAAAGSARSDRGLRRSRIHGHQPRAARTLGAPRVRHRCLWR
jgi:hypothetical protein